MTSTKDSPQLKIAMLAASLPPMPAGGAEMQAFQLAKELSNKGHLVFFFTPGNNLAKGQTQIDGIAIYRCHSFFNQIFHWFSDLKNRNTKPSVQIEYYNIFFLHSFFLLWVKRRSFDIIHAHTIEWSAIVAARLGRHLKKPVVIKDSTMNGFQSLERFPRGKTLQQMVIKSSHFVAMTKVIEKNFLNAGIPAKKITQIPNGIFVHPLGKKR